MDRLGWRWSLGVVLFCWISAIVEMTGGMAYAEEIPYFNPYTQDFSAREAKKIYVSSQVVVYDDAKNSKGLTKEFLDEIVREIEENLLPNYSFLFSFLDNGPKFPIYFIFSDQLKRNGGASVLYQAFYTPFYKERYGYEAILVSTLDIKKEELFSFIAHELFHLFYRLKEAHPPVWMDEGLAQFFAYHMTGFVPQLQVAKYFEDPLVALEEFPEGLPRYYGHAFLFFFYLKEHFLTTQDLPKLAIVSHPKNLFDEATWKKILREFSLAKLLNTIYLHEERHYSLKPLFGKVRPLQFLPSNFLPQHALTVYLQGSSENRKVIADLRTQFKEGWSTELIFVISPAYRKITITEDDSLLSESVPYTIVFNIY